MPDLAIRTYEPSDYRAVVAALKAADLYDDVWEGPENLLALRNNIFVAEVGGEYRGSLYTTPIGVNVAIIYRFVVPGEYRGQGVGSSLLSFAEQELRKRGFKDIALYQDASHGNLDNFYQKRGYQTGPHQYSYKWKPLG